MHRYALVALAVAVAAPAQALRIAPAPPPVARALKADVVVVGKVTAIEKDTVDVVPYPGDPKKVPHKVAVVKVETPLAGADQLTHVKIGFVPPPEGGRPVRGPRAATPTEGQEALFFLTKHHTGNFYTMGYMTAPVDATDANFKAEVENVKKALAVVADPLKALKAEKQAERFFAAAALLRKYRTAPDGVEVALQKVAAEESQLILKALAEQKDWGQQGAVGSGTQALFMLGLGEADGWKNPMPRPGVPTDVNAMYRDAFAAWLAGRGAAYQVTKMVKK